MLKQASLLDRLQVPAKLWKALLERCPQPMHGDVRRFPRYPVLAYAVLEFDGGLPAFPRSSERHRVLTIDLSRCGLRFLHSAELFPGEWITLYFPQDKKVLVQVARCRKVATHCYEVGSTLRDPVLSQQPAP